MEGPSIVILKEEAAFFIGKKIINVSGNSKIDQQLLLNQKVIALKSWGKHFLICFKGFYMKVHFLMFGSYRINERKENPRLSLEFKSGEFNFYSCSIKIVEGSFSDSYDEEVDVMSDKWNEKKALRNLKTLKEKTLVCDALLDQQLFAGVGNIIKNEVLFRIRIHPESYVNCLTPKLLKEVIREARQYSFDFYKWKKVYELKKHWLIYKKKICPRCDIPFVRTYSGKQFERLTFFCKTCQVKYR